MLTLVQARKIFKEGTNGETSANTSKRVRADSGAEYPVAKVTLNSPAWTRQNSSAPTLSESQGRSSAKKTAGTKQHLEQSNPSRRDKEGANVSGSIHGTPSSPSEMTEERNTFCQLTNNFSPIMSNFGTTMNRI